MNTTPPQLTAIHSETGHAFQLTDETFNRWWYATILPEDADEFVNLLHGTIDEARFVCAMEYITGVLNRKASADDVVMAYFMARNEPLDLKDATARLNATYLSQSDATLFLLDRVRSRSVRVAEQRVAARVTAKIEELFERSKGDLDEGDRLDLERLALEAGIKFMANQARERGQESDRRAKKAIKDAIERSKHTEYDVKRVPSLAEAKLHLAMLVDAHGADAVAEIVQEVAPHADDPHP